MTTDNKSFALYPCCVVVDGKTKSSIYDLQRESFWLIPHALAYLLKHDSRLSIAEIKKKYPGNEDAIDEYMRFLSDNDLGVFCGKDDIRFKDIPQQVNNPHLITNAIFDYDKDSDYDLREGIRQLSEMGCENLELRFFNEISMERLETIVSFTKETCIRDLEILVPYSSDYLLDNVLELRYRNSRIRKMTISGCPEDEECVYNHEEIYIMYTSEAITSECHCGVVSPWYLLPKTELYMESLFYNNCLNRKIAIDKHGNIKNCPSMKKSYGKFFGQQKLVDVAKREDFQQVWKIRKDDINQCRDCELRYMCQDCRAYTVDPEDAFSRPLKCNYNPY